MTLATPPTISNSAFGSDTSGLTIVVPAGSATLYTPTLQVGATTLHISSRLTLLHNRK